jgi:hypothetical protein
MGAALGDLGLGGGRGGFELANEIGVELGGDAAEEIAGGEVAAVGGVAETEAELGVVLEEGVGPRGATAGGVLAVGSGGEVAAVDGGAAGGVGDDEAVAEDLGEELDVGRLAAAGAGAGELEEGLGELASLDGGEGSFSKKSQWARSISMRGAAGTRSRALCFGFDLSLAGQTWTQSEQPVQSSGATWMK